MRNAYNCEHNDRPNISHGLCNACRQRYISWGRQGIKITFDIYFATLKQQNFVCAICNKTCVTGKSLAVDHDPKTGKVRGLLCAKCNRGIGNFNDDPVLLELAAKYAAQGVL